MQEEFVELERRLISGKGLIKFPEETYRSLILYVQVVREPFTPFKNFNWEPPKSLYCRCTSSIDDYVIADFAIEYESQAFHFVADVSGQALKAVQCAYEGLLQSFVNLIPCFGGVCFPTTVTNNTADMAPLPFKENRVAFSCFSTTALEVTLFGLKYGSCGGTNDEAPPPPPPPPKRAKLPPNQPIGEISPPYPDGDDVTEPNPIDETLEPPDLPPFPFGGECQLYVVTGAITNSRDGRVVRSDLFYGEIENFFFNPSSISKDGKESILIVSRGLAVFNGVPQPCGDPTQQVFLQTDSELFISYELISVDIGAEN